MNRIIYILLTIVFFQLLGMGYIKFIDKTRIENRVQIEKNSYNNPNINTLLNDSIKTILEASKELPQSMEYTVWDKKTVEYLSKKILKKTKIERKNTIVLLDKTKKSGTKIIKKKILKKHKSISISQKLEKYAKEKLGQKYVWGATGPNKFDCSGFTLEVFRSTVGIKIPRVSRDQAKVGKYIKYRDLHRGDMVFFDTEKKFTRRVNHVGIYLSNGNFIHASSARKKVIITNFRKKPFYKRRFLWGRRIINSRL